MLTSIVASIQCTEAVKILTCSPDIRRTMLAFDIWNNEFDELEVEKNPDCPVCVHEDYEYYGKTSGSRSTSLCGRNSIQVNPAGAPAVDFDEIALNGNAAATFAGPATPWTWIPAPSGSNFFPTAGPSSPARTTQPKPERSMRNTWDSSPAYAYNFEICLTT